MRNYTTKKHEAMDCDAQGGNGTSLSVRGVPEAPLLRFPLGMFPALRSAFLQDTSREQFGIILGRMEKAPDGRIIMVAQDVMIAGDCDLISSGLCQVRPAKEFIARALSAAQRDLKVNAIIDVHTHPFCKSAHFSGVDDADELEFGKWLHSILPDLGYASLLLSLEAWEARVWDNGRLRPALVKTQSPLEEASHISTARTSSALPEMQNRTALALGVDTVRMISAGHRIVLAGVGGLGSVMAEQLVRSGFTNIGLIDDDILELTNLNRFAGGFRSDLGKPKVDVAKEHLLRINPDAYITAIKAGVENPDAQSLMAGADWIMLSTDSHSSRQIVQDAALRFGAPIISTGVSITVASENGRHSVVDRSGEVIVARHGEGFCLHCLGRINPYKVAAESNPDAQVREGLVQKGYVSGIQEKEPAVMPLNSVLASMAVQALLDQYTQGATFIPLQVYESHAGSCCYPDNESLDRLPAFCASCGRNIFS